MKKFLSLVLALVMTMSLVVTAGAAEPFTDKADIDYAEAVDVLRAVGVLDGYTDGSFRPDNALNRGQAAKIICNLILGPTAAAALPTSVAPYADVPAGSTFAGYIAYLAKEGIVGGYADGTFRPEAPLNGYAFMKMLLGVLGYDAKIEGYEGANYAVSVAKQALAIDLDDGLVGSFVGTKTVTRQEAMLFALNTLKAKWVTYENKGANITIGGVVINTGASEAKVNTGNQTYEDKLFGTDLTYSVDANDSANFGRSTITWTYKNKKVGTYANKTPILTYTTRVKEKDIFADLGVDGISGTGTKYVVMNQIHEDGVKNSWADYTTYYAANASSGDCADSVIIVKGDTSWVAGSGEGVKVEIYKTDVNNVYEMVIVSEYLTKVNSITKANDKAGTKRAINTARGSFETENFAKGDYVIVTESAGTIKSAVAATKIENVRVEAYKDNTSVTFGGVTYKYSQHAAVKNTAFKMTAKDTYTFYLDTYGNVIGVAEYSVSSTDYVLVLANSASNAGDEVTGQYKNVKYIDATGKTTVVKTYGTGATANAWYTVSEDADHAGYHKFTAVNTSDVTDAVQAYYSTGSSLTSNKLIKTQPQIATNVKADAGTVFVLKTGATTYKTYTGIASVPTYESIPAGVFAVVGKDGYADIVYIDVTAASAANSASDDIAYVLSTTPAGTYYDAANKVYYAELNAIVKGEKTTLKFAVTSADTRTVVSAANNAGLVKINTYDANGYICSTSVLTSSGYAQNTSLNAKTIAFSNPTLTVDGTAYLAADAVVYMIDADDALTVGTVEDLVGTTTASASNVMYVVYKSTTDNTVTAIYFDGGLA